MSYQAVVFDMDGVLIDSKHCMKLCWEEVKCKTGTNIDFNEYFSKIGKPFKVILSEIGLPQECWRLAEEVYFKAQEYYIGEIRPYEGIENLLDDLSRDYILGLVTSKGSKAVNLILKKFGWKFSQIITPDNCARGKPYPDPLLYFTAYEQMAPLSCVYVGDMTVDMEAARMAGFKFIRAAWGYQVFDAESAETPKELFQIIKDLK